MQEQIQNAQKDFENMSYTTRKTCRVCGSDRLTSLFSLGNLYISNFIDKDTKSLKAPLELVFCENCTLVQLKDTAPQELLYAGFYWYKSGITDTMKRQLRNITETVETRFPLKQGDIVLDIGSNDGTMLRTYEVPGIITVGVEPASNLAEEGKKGISIFINDFWNRASWQKAMGNKKAKIITAIGMFYDMEDPNQFIKDAADTLTDDGAFIAQLMCLRNMLESNDIGNICHEHLEYYSFTSLEHLFSQNGLEIFDVEVNEVNGGSYRLFARKKGSTVTTEGAAERVAKAKEDEKDLQSKEVYMDFFKRMEENKKKCVDFIKQEVAKGKKVWVYGASTKGNTILQYYGLDHTTIEAASERTPAKWGKFTVGTMIPIVSEEEARKAQPDYFLVLPYTFIKEFYEREKDWREKGGKFLVPLPEFKVLE